MALSHPKVSRALAVAGLLGLAALGGGRASGQHTADPYNPYNQEYDSFVYSQYPTTPGSVPNQAILEGRVGLRSANQFQGFMNGLEGIAAEDKFGTRRTGPGVAYYSGYRRYDREYNRNSQLSPNNQAYYDDRDKRDEAYMAYLRERDPRRRAQLYREYTQLNRRNARDLNATRTSQSQSRAARIPRPEPAAAKSNLPGGRAPSTAPESATVPGRRARRGSAASTTPSARAATPSPSEVLRRSRAIPRRDPLVPAAEPRPAATPR